MWYDEDLRGSDPDGVGDGGAGPSGQVREMVRLHHHDELARLAVLAGEGRAGPRREPRDLQDGSFDVLGVVFLAEVDDNLVGSSGNEELTLVHVSEVTDA
jgi:hypothetical protein